MICPIMTEKYRYDCEKENCPSYDEETGLCFLIHGAKYIKENKDIPISTPKEPSTPSAGFGF